MTILICLPLILVVGGLAGRRWFMATRQDIRSIESHRVHLNHLEHLGPDEALAESAAGRNGSAHVRIVGQAAGQPGPAVRPMVWGRLDGRPAAARPAWHSHRDSQVEARYQRARMEAMEQAEEHPPIVITDDAVAGVPDVASEPAPRPAARSVVPPRPVEEPEPARAERPASPAEPARAARPAASSRTAAAAASVVSARARVRSGPAPAAAAPVGPPAAPLVIDDLDDDPGVFIGPAASGSPVADPGPAVDPGSAAARVGEPAGVASLDGHRKQYRAGHRPARVLAAAAGLVVVAAGAGVAIHEVRSGSGRPAAHTASPPGRAGGSVTPATTVAPPAPTTPPTLAATSTSATDAVYTITAGSLEVSVATSAPCWMELRSGSPSGPVAYEGTLPAGASRTFSAANGLWLRLGDPAGVQLRINGSAVTLPSAPNPFNITVTTA